MKKSPNILKSFSLFLVLPFLLNSCTSKDWYNPSLKDLSNYQARQIKQMYITRCSHEAEIKAKQMYAIRYCGKGELIYQGQVISTTTCNPPNETLANIQYVTDYQNFFKECMVRNGFFEVKIDSKCYKTCRNNGNSSDNCNEQCIVTNNN